MKIYNSALVLAAIVAQQTAVHAFRPTTFGVPRQQRSASLLSLSMVEEAPSVVARLSDRQARKVMRDLFDSVDSAGNTKQAVQDTLLNDATSALLQGMNYTVRTSMLKRIQDYASAQGLSVDASFGQPSSASSAPAPAAPAPAPAAPAPAPAAAKEAPAPAAEAAPANAVTPKTIKALRDATGAGMMDCKQALLECDGDAEAAADFLRKKGLIKADKKASRVAAEGKIVTAVDPSTGKAVLVEVNCETDFVAKDQSFSAYCEKVAAQALTTADGTSVPDLLAGDLEAERQALVAKIGENIQVRRFTSRGGDNANGVYVHMNRIGVIVEIAGGNEEVATAVAMHVAAMNPPYATADQVPADVLDKERQILSQQALESGKPPEIVEKMVEGRIRKYLEEICLDSQPFVRDSSMTVAQYIAQNCGKDAKLVGFSRIAVGEGIEKKEDNFAEEVAKMAGKPAPAPAAEAAAPAEPTPEPAAAPAPAPAPAAAGGEITPKTIKALRDATGAGMMDCKKALIESDGDQEAAAEYLRKKGLAKADKKASRVAAEGKIVTFSDGGKAVMVEVNCETDFVAKDSNFQEYCDKVAAAAINSADVPTLMGTNVDGTTLEEERQALVAQIGENIQVRRLSSRGGKDSVTGTYVHMNRIGVLVEAKKLKDDADVSAAENVAMHIAAMNPPYATPDEVPQDVLDNEKRILSEQALDSGKPPEIVEKMVEGRIRKYLEEICCVSQPFVRDSAVTVGQYLKDNGLEMIGFSRLAVGEGIEKAEDNFAEEVAQMAAGKM